MVSRTRTCFILEFYDYANRAENFFLNDTHIRRAVGEDRGLVSMAS
jgi:hypothetical protein